MCFLNGKYEICAECSKEIVSQKIMKLGGKNYHMVCGMNKVYKHGKNN